LSIRDSLSSKTRETELISKPDFRSEEGFPLEAGDFTAQIVGIETVTFGQEVHKNQIVTMISDDVAHVPISENDDDDIPKVNINYSYIDIRKNYILQANLPGHTISICDMRT